MEPYNKRDNLINDTLNIHHCQTYLRGVDDLISEGLGDGLEASEGRLTGTLADQVDGLVDSAEG